MSGHSKWSQIRHKKELTDQKRGQMFSKLSKNITLAARKGADPKNNVALANAIEQARRENMPNENIERAIKKVSEKDGAQPRRASLSGSRPSRRASALEEIIVEAIGPDGTALRIKGITDNKNRTISEIKKVLSNYEAKMVQPGSIGWMFNNAIQVNERVQQELDKLFDVLVDNPDVVDIVSNLE